MKTETCFSMKMLLKVLSLTALFFFFSGCEKWDTPGWSYPARYSSELSHLKCENAGISTTEEEYVTGSDADIVGSWKLLLDFSAGDATDRSCNSIIYTFYANGTVTIESGIKEIPGGTFEYEYFNNGDPFCPTCLPAPDLAPNLIIGENKYYCQIAQSWLTTIFVRYYKEQETGKEARTYGEVEKIFHKIN
jgi:hypothetical protein